MAVITRTQNRNTADYTALTDTDQDLFDEVMERADNAGPCDGYPALMLAAAAITGLRIPYGGHIRKCACSCWCPVIFDLATDGAHVIEGGNGYNLGRHQCPTCADRHRETA